MVWDYELKMRVRSPRPTVFERLLRIEHLARWFCGWARIDPKVGGAFRFGGETCIFQPEGRGWETRIGEGEVLRRFAFEWPIHGTPTRVAYDLEDAGDAATILVARHQGVPVPESGCGSVLDAWRVCLGNLKSIGEGRGESVRPDHTLLYDGQWSLATIVEASTDRVYEALVTPAQVDGWSTGGVPSGRVTPEPEPGAMYAFGDPDGPLRVLELVPGRGLALGDTTPGRDARWDLRLEEKASGTAVYVSAAGPSDATRALRDRGRWSDRLVALKNLVEGGDPGFENPYEAQARQR